MDLEEKLESERLAIRPTDAWDRTGEWGRCPEWLRYEHLVDDLTNNGRMGREHVRWLAESFRGILGELG